MEFARASALHFGVSLHEYYVTPADVLDAIPKIAAAYDEPFGNASAIPAYYCAKFARENGFDALLAGDGGDEIFAGNFRYFFRRTGQSDQSGMKGRDILFELFRPVPFRVYGHK